MFEIIQLSMSTKLRYSIRKTTTWWEQWDFWQFLQQLLVCSYFFCTSWYTIMHEFCSPHRFGIPVVVVWWSSHHPVLHGSSCQDRWRKEAGQTLEEIQRIEMYYWQISLYEGCYTCFWDPLAFGNYKWRFVSLVDQKIVLIRYTLLICFGMDASEFVLCCETWSSDIGGTTSLIGAWPKLSANMMHQYVIQFGNPAMV